MRGTDKQPMGDIREHGIIPACAGNSALNVSVFSYKRDHPRVCGEQLLDEVALMPRSGSSPRVRGTEVIEIVDGQPQGIIPACAGNSRTASTSVGSSRDHPRVCGEQLQTN